MTEVQTAHVKTLTASIRTLMVNKQMVTLSMAKQLDVIDIAYMVDIFGRVKVDIGLSDVVVVGTDDAGRLRVAAAPHHAETLPVTIGRDHTGEEFFVCVGTAHQQNVQVLGRGALYQVKRGHRSLRLQAAVVSRTCGTKGAACDCKEPWGAANLSRYQQAWEDIQAAERVQGARPAKVREARQSELLILAGLR